MFENTCFVCTLNGRHGQIYSNVDMAHAIVKHEHLCTRTMSARQRNNLNLMITYNMLRGETTRNVWSWVYFISLFLTMCHTNIFNIYMDMIIFTNRNCRFSEWANNMICRWHSSSSPSISSHIIIIFIIIIVFMRNRVWHKA